MNNDLTLEEFKNFAGKVVVASLAKGGKSKRLEMFTSPVEDNIWYEITVNHEVVYSAPGFTTAINEYNSY